ncbi:sulfatase, partial [Candidatus Sumerlaeota bacterium]|nr:sulfatase [Candidatus Sumerlaeota bacterium]
ALTAAQESERPNIIVVMADDLGIGDIGPYGATLIRTPHLDRMAAEGAVLTSFYSSANICTPSRGGLLTGRYPARLGLTRDVARPTNDIGIQEEETTLAEALKGVGYATACIGKWHLGHRPEHWPTRHGFDYFYGLPYSNDMTPLALYRQNENIEEPVDQRTLTERYTREAVQFIEKNKDRPFFLYLPHTMPHIPLFVSDRFKGLSGAGLYGDVVETIDWSMGRIFSTLDRLGIDDNTLVIFTSDNGPWFEGSAGDNRGRKGTAWEGGMRVPFLARWPGRIPAGGSSDAIAMNIDLFPTLTELAGIDPPGDRTIDGRNIFALMKGDQRSPHEYLYFFNKEILAAVRTQRWKLVVQSWYRAWNAPLGSESYHYYPGLLFDLENDPEERYSYTREHPDLAKQLRQWIDQGRRDLIEPGVPARSN